MKTPDHLEVAFQQRPYVAKCPDDMKYGMCVGFSAEWVIRHRSDKGEEIKKRVEYLTSDGAVGNAEKSQRAYRNSRTVQDNVISTGQKASVETAFSSLNAKITIAKTDKVDYYKDQPADFLKAMFEKTDDIRVHYVMILSFGESRLNLTDDNHMIIGYHSSGKLRGWGSHLYVFEPNFGEFKLAGNEVKPYFQALADAYEGYEDSKGTKAVKKLRMVTIHALSPP